MVAERGLRALGARSRRRGPPPAVFVLLAPACVMFAIFVIFPIIQSLWLSLQDWDGVGVPRWVGFANFAELVGDPGFWVALRNNMLWLLGSSLAPAIGLGLALFLNQTVRGIRVIRALFFAPFVISQVVVGLVFAWFFHAEFGLLDAALRRLGLQPLALLAHEELSIIAVITASLWPQAAYCTILYLTGLMSLRPEMIEAARVDGAGGWALLWDIVIPALRPVTFIVAMVCVVGAMRSFDLVVIMTGGGPYGQSSVLAHYMYEQVFLASRHGYGAAVAAVLFAVMGACVGLFLWRLLRGERA